MNIEIAEVRDELSIKSLLTECELPSEDISLTDRQQFLLVRDRGGDQLVGVVGIERLGCVGLLRSLAVSPSHRRKGIASQLVRQAEERARSCGVVALYLLTMTAEEFFAKRGYQRVNRSGVPEEIKGTAEFRSLCPASAVCMMKSL